MLGQSCREDSLYPRNECSFSESAHGHILSLLNEHSISRKSLCKHFWSLTIAKPADAVTIVCRIKYPFFSGCGWICLRFWYFDTCYYVTACSLFNSYKSGQMRTWPMMSTFFSTWNLLSRHLASKWLIHATIFEVGPILSEEPVCLLLCPTKCYMMGSLSPEKGYNADVFQQGCILSQYWANIKRCSHYSVRSQRIGKNRRIQKLSFNLPFMSAVCS